MVVGAGGISPKLHEWVSGSKLPEWWETSIERKISREKLKNKKWLGVKS
jgi:hypothetical protein